jgi:hypothetical protein
MAKMIKINNIQDFSESCQNEFHHLYGEYLKSCGVRIEANPVDPNICDIVYTVVSSKLQELESPESKQSVNIPVPGYSAFDTIFSIGENSAKSFSEDLKRLDYLEESSKVVISEIHQANVLGIIGAFVRMLETKGIYIVGKSIEVDNLHEVADALETEKERSNDNPIHEIFEILESDDSDSEENGNLN